MVIIVNKTLLSFFLSLCFKALWLFYPFLFQRVDTKKNVVCLMSNAIVLNGKSTWVNFLTLVGISNVLHVINFLLLVNSNMVQIVITVLVRIMGYFAMHQLNFVHPDFNYNRIDLGIK